MIPKSFDPMPNLIPLSLLDGLPWQFHHHPKAVRLVFVQQSLEPAILRTDRLIRLTVTNSVTVGFGEAGARHFFVAPRIIHADNKMGLTIDTQEAVRTDVHFGSLRTPNILPEAKRE